MSGEALSPEALLGGLLIAGVSVGASFALARGARRSDDARSEDASHVERLSRHEAEMARHDVRLDQAERTLSELVKAHADMQRATDKTLQSIALQLNAITTTLGTEGRTGMSRIMGEIQVLTDRIRAAQGVDHTLLTALTERVRMLETLLKVVHPELPAPFAPPQTE